MICDSQAFVFDAPRLRSYLQQCPGAAHRGEHSRSNGTVDDCRGKTRSGGHFSLDATGQSAFRVEQLAADYSVDRLIEGWAVRNHLEGRFAHLPIDYPHGPAVCHETLPHILRMLNYSQRATAAGYPMRAGYPTSGFKEYLHCCHHDCSMGYPKPLCAFNPDLKVERLRRTFARHVELQPRAWASYVPNYVNNTP